MSAPPTSELLERLLADRRDLDARISAERSRLRHRYLGINHNAVRAWALANGYGVGVRGRVPQLLVEAYLAHQAETQAQLSIDLGEAS